MNYIEESKRRRELIARLKKRMMPLYDNHHPLTNKYEPKNLIEFGSSVEDFELLHDLVETLIGDVLYFESQNIKINIREDRIL